ncbi:MAG: hypothetical protein ACHWZW_07845 [Spirulina sp.]
MSAMEKSSWPAAQGDTTVPPADASEATKPQAERPTLVAPPARPVRPTPPKPTPPVVAPVVPAAEKAPEKEPEKAPPTAPEPAFDPAAYRHLPIAPPSEPMQYRAIGLVRGTYVPTEADQINRGNLTTDDGLTVDSVLLGRVTSLVKKHLDLTAPHLWVVYPRTRRETETDEDQDLHFQIVGVWEPETLGLPGEDPQGTPDDASEEILSDDNEEATAAKATKVKEGSQDQESKAQDPAPAAPASQGDAAPWPTVDENYFSIRGEVVKHEPEQGLITVKILQGIKRTPGGAKSFKLTLQGQIEGRTVGYFWDFQVKRSAKILAVETASVVGIVPPKKRPKGSGGGGRRPVGKRPGGPRSSAPPRKPMGTHGSPRPRKVISEGGDTPA